MKSQFQPSLLRWYDQNKRDLPWRQTKEPYRIWISEIMLQQTQVQTVIPYYERFVSLFPTLGALAQSPLNKVLKAWEGLGYYSRARNLHTFAKEVVRRHAGRIPAQFDQLSDLPGIGRYTAGAVLSIAFGQNYPVLDGNVQRVLTRLYAITDDLRLPATSKKLWTLAESLLPASNAGDYNQALMELGATLCLPKNPQCERCPVRTYCRAWKAKKVAVIPFKSKAKATPHFDIGAGVIWKEEKILISQRPLKGLLGGLWEFPGGKKESRESLPQCVTREIKEELDIDVRVGQKIAQVNHAYSHFRITLHVYHCTYVKGRPRAIGCKTWRWVYPRDLSRFAFPAANQPIIRYLLEKDTALIPK